MKCIGHTTVTRVSHSFTFSDTDAFEWLFHYYNSESYKSNPSDGEKKGNVTNNHMHSAQTLAPLLSLTINNRLYEIGAFVENSASYKRS